MHGNSHLRNIGRLALALGLFERPAVPSDIVAQVSLGLCALARARLPRFACWSGITRGLILRVIDNCPWPLRVNTISAQLEDGQ